MRGHETTIRTPEILGSQVHWLESRLIGEARALVVEKIGFDNLTVEGRGLTSVWNPELYAAVQKVEAANKDAINRVKAQKDKVTNSGGDWLEEVRYKAFNASVQSTIADRFLRQSVTPADAEALSSLPIRDKFLPSFTDDWLSFVLKRHSEHATEGELERLATVFSTMGNHAPVLPSHKYHGATRTIVTSEGTMPVEAYKLKKLRHTFQVRSAGLPLGDKFLDQLDPQAFRRVAELGWNDCDFIPAGRAPQNIPSARNFREVLRHSGLSTEQTQRALMAAGVASLATTVIVSPAAAQGNETVQAAATNPASISIGFTGQPKPVIVIQQPVSVASAKLSVPTAPSEAFPAVSLLDQSSVDTSTGLSVPLSETVDFIGHTPALPALPEQKLHAEPDTLDKLKEGGLTPQERIAAQVQTFGSKAPTLETQETKDKPAAPSTYNQLSRKNPLLARYLNNELSSVEQRLGTQELTDFTLLEEAQYSIVLLRSALVNPESLKGLSEDQKKEILSAHSAEYTEALHLKANEILKIIQAPKLGSGEGYDKDSQELLSHIIAKLELTVGPKAELNALVQSVRDQYENETPNDVGFGTENEPKAPADNDKEKPISNSELQMKALDIMMKSDDIYIARGAHVTKELLTLPENLDGRITLSIAFGAVANVRDETGTQILDFSTKQKGGPARGGFQWEGQREVELLEFADREGKSWTLQTVQLMHFINELEGPESAAWDKIKNADNAKDAATLILQYFERAADSKPGGKNDDERRIFAAQLQKAYDKAVAQFKEGDKPQQKSESKEVDKTIKPMGEKAKAELDAFLGSVTREGSQLTSGYVNKGIEDTESRGLKNGRFPSSELVKVSKQGHRLQHAAAASYLAMDAAFNTDNPGKHLDFGTILTAYRTYKQQEDLKKRKGKWAADAGTSNHGMGRAGDFSDMSAGSLRDKWMKANGWKFGWFKPVGLGPNSPKGTYEPWHYEFVLVNWED